MGTINEVWVATYYIEGSGLRGGVTPVSGVKVLNHDSGVTELL